MSTIVYYVLTQRGGFSVKHTRIKMICIVIGMIPLLSTVVNAVSMGGISLLHAAGDAETGELPKGTALCIAEAIPEEYSPEELITNTYHEDMLSDLGIDKTGEILDFNFAAKNLYDLTHGIPKLLLTATPLQNALTDLHGLVSFIDPRIFGSEKVFNRRFVEGGDYEELKQELLPVLYRTLRRDVGKYMAFSKRTCITVDFHLGKEERELYEAVNNFLKKENLYSIPSSNRALIILVVRKLLASSSFALIDTFEVLQKRLEKLYEGTKSAKAQEGFDLFWAFVEDEIDETGFDDIEDDETVAKKQEIQDELDEVHRILDVAREIKSNAKIKALQEALATAFARQRSEGIAEHAVIFTESITICENGHMNDFPWSWWVHNGSSTCKGTLRMYSTGNTSTLADMWVECSCGAKRSMSGATQKENFEGMTCSGHHPFRPHHKNEKCDKILIPSQRGALTLG